MSETIDELYFDWLYNQVGSHGNRTSYYNLLRQLHDKEFVWFVPNDANRVEDGRDLRMIFLHDTGFNPDREFLNRGCSMLEMLIALSHRLAFEAGRRAKQWFWRLMDNLDLEELTDANWGDLTWEAVDEVLDRVIWRTYEPDGLGGLFPLEHPEKDQREVEIWYQLNAYLLDTEN